MTSTTSSTGPDGPGGDARLAAEVTRFADRLMGTLGGVLERDVQFSVEIGLGADQRHVIVQPEDGHVVITIDAKPVFELLVRYRCVWNSTREHFAVDESEIALFLVGGREPLLHFDYKRSMGGDVPVAHINVHAHRDEVVYAMMLGTRKRARRRAKAVEAGRVPRLAQLHLPVGGHRFRPGLEDVLEMLVHEFGIDAATHALPVIRAARAEYRSTQVRTVVTDDPDAAAASLRHLGYRVEAPSGPRPARQDRLERY